MSSSSLTHAGFELLSAALRQNDWRIECEPARFNTPARTLDIVDFGIVPFDTGRVDLSLTFRKEGNEEKFEESIGKVFLVGVLGMTYPEPRRFEVSFLGISKKYRKQEGTDIVFYRRLKSGSIGLVFVRDANAPPGWPLYKSAFHSSTYGFSEHMRHRVGTGDNRLRTPRLAQPKALKEGDVLATGERVLSSPRAGFNGIILLHLTRNSSGHWVEVDPWIPIALLSEEDYALVEAN